MVWDRATGVSLKRLFDASFHLGGGGSMAGRGAGVAARSMYYIDDMPYKVSAT
jgi:hypothetical protein